MDDRSGIPGTAQGQSDAFASLSMEMAFGARRPSEVLPENEDQKGKETED